MFVLVGFLQKLLLLNLTVSGESAFRDQNILTCFRRKITSAEKSLFLFDIHVRPFIYSCPLMSPLGGYDTLVPLFITINQSCLFIRFSSDIYYCCAVAEQR